MDEKITISAKATFKTIESGIKELSAMVANCSFIHASVAKLPIAEIEENGRDTVFDEIKQCQLSRYDSYEAIKQYIESIQLQTKSREYSNKAGRRYAGIIHLSITQEKAKTIADKIKTINKAKQSLENMMTDKKNFESYYARSKFYQEHFTGYLMVSVYRKIPMAKQPVKRFAFSWIQNGYIESRITYESAKNLITKRVEAKVKTNPNLNEDNLYQSDINRLNSASQEDLYWLRPSKLNPRVDIVYENGEETTVRASVPILVLQPNPLKQYAELNDYNGVIRKTVGVKTAERTPIIYEYGLFQKDSKKLETHK